MRFAFRVLIVAVLLCLGLACCPPAMAQVDCAGGSCGLSQGLNLAPPGIFLPPLPLPAPPAPFVAQTDQLAYVESRQSFYRTGSYSRSTRSYAGPAVQSAGLIARGLGISRGAVRRVGRIVTAPFRLCR